MSANEKGRQVGGEHYGGGSIQHWDIVHMFELDYFQGQITKYVMRWKKKGGIQDLEKARHFLEKYIELQGAAKTSPGVSAQEKQIVGAVSSITPPVKFSQTELARRHNDGFTAEGHRADGNAVYTCKRCRGTVIAMSVDEAYRLHAPGCTNILPQRTG